MSDDRLFFKLHNGFPEHPKTVELSDKAFRQLIEAWCYCSRNLNDGVLTKAQFFKLFSSKTRRELIAVGFIDEDENSYAMHDYLKDQMSAQQVADLREHRQEAGRKGGKAKAKGLASAKANAKQTGSKPLPDIDIDVDSKEADASLPARNATSKPIPGDFHVTAAMQAWAIRTVGSKQEIDLDLETEKFIAHAHEKTVTSASWPDTWRKWILKAVEFAQRDQAKADATAQRALGPWDPEFHK